MDRSFILTANVIVGLVISGFWLASPAIPESDQATLSELHALWDNWEYTCNRDARGEHDARFASEADLVQRTLTKRDALRAKLVMDPTTKSTLARRIWSQDDWVVNQPWLCLN